MKSGFFCEIKSLILCSEYYKTMKSFNLFNIRWKIKMASSDNLRKAKAVKNDEFYTQLDTISKEMNHYHEYNKDVFRDKTILCPCDDPDWSQFQNYFVQLFEWYGIKKLICTSYAPKSKNVKTDVISLLETKSDKFDADKSFNRGKVYILDRDKDVNKDGCITKEDVTWEYLEGDGDFRSDEIKPYLDEADMIITNPPFSLFREFIKWIMDAKKEFIILGNLNSIKCKDIFPLIKDNKIWLGWYSGSIEYKKPNGEKQKLGNTCWYTNVPHGKRYDEYIYMKYETAKRTGQCNKKFKEYGFKKYDNYNAIEVPECRYIPDDYYEPMGVPISFLFKHNPKDFVILDCINKSSFIKEIAEKNKGKCICQINGKELYARIIIKRKKSETN